MNCHKPSQTAIEPARLARSVHGKLDCGTCHMEGFSQYPHSGKRTDALDCMDCHGGDSSLPYEFDKVANAVKDSVHVTVVDAAFRCTNCHSPHYFIPATSMKDLLAGINLTNQNCFGCHPGRGDMRDARLSLKKFDDARQVFPCWGSS